MLLAAFRVALLNDATRLIPIAAALNLAIVVLKFSKLCQANFLAPTKIVPQHAEGWHLIGLSACLAAFTLKKLLQNHNQCLVATHKTLQCSEALVKWC